VPSFFGEVRFLGGRATRLCKKFAGMKSTVEANYFIKELMDPFFRQVHGERSMYLSR